eukprot:sb/3476086/
MTKGAAAAKEAAAVKHDNSCNGVNGDAASSPQLGRLWDGEGDLGFTDLKKKWENGKQAHIQLDGEPTSGYSNEEIRELLEQSVQLPSVEELRDKIQAGSISNGGYVVDPYMLNERTKDRE